MPNATIEMLHHQKVRYYRHELATAPEGARRTLLLSLMVLRRVGPPLASVANT